MSEAIETFRAMNQYHREQRAAGRESAPKILEDAGIDHTAHNGGAHIIVHHRGKRIDFWPGPGKWRDYKTGEHGNDIESLIEYVKEQS